VTSDPPILVSTLPCANGATIGVLALNRPRALNALNLEMCERLHAQLIAWKDDTTIAAVVLKAEGEKAFCAGGDVAEVVRHVKAGGPQRYAYGDTFFAVEYALDLLIHTYPKPIIALAHGITMGGGVGLIVGASHRVVSTAARIAMPEIHIGLFPDVGGGYFLNRVPCRAGWLMALTGLIINEHDAVLAGLVDAIVPTAQFDALCAALTQCAAPLTRAQVTAVINGFSARQLASVDNAPMWQRMPKIHALMHAPDVIAARDALREAALADDWFAAPAQNLAQGSPTTAHVAWEYLRRSVTLGIAQVLELDLVLAKQFPRHADFLEGVRAVLIDKDKSPKWTPGAFESVPDSVIEAHFRAL
jgi:enoyl-CoA hydratase/carnithine racemase